jgi:MFS family permease
MSTVMAVEPATAGRGMTVLFGGTLLTAAGYGATFLLTEHFRALGGSELDTGRILGAAMAGTAIGVPMVGWIGPRFGGARLAALGALAVAAGYALLAAISALTALHLVCGLLIGFGWGTFYLAAPMAVSERVTDADRGLWFTRFGAFQMAGIGASPVLALWLAHEAALSTRSIFAALAALLSAAAAALWMFERIAPRRAVAATTNGGGHVNWIAGLLPLLRTRAAFPILMVGLGASVFTGLMTFQSSLVRGTALQPGLYFAVYAGVVVLSRFTLAPAMNRADGDRVAPMLLALMCAGVAAMFFIAGGAAVQAGSAVLLGLGYGLVYSVIQTQAVNEAPPPLRTAALTWFVVSYFVGIFGFPLLGAWLIVHSGTQVFLWVVLALGLAEAALALLRLGRARRI